MCEENVLCASKDMPILTQIIGVKILRTKLYLLPFMDLITPGLWFFKKLESFLKKFR